MHNWKTDQGIWLTRSLFWELVSVPEKRKHCVYTLKDEPLTTPDGRVLDSFPALYRALCFKDPSEYTLATECFGGWKHWTIISNSKLFKDVVEELREENAVRLKAEAYKYLIKEVESEGKSAYSSAKYLLDHGVIKTGDKKKDRARSQIQNKKASNVVSADAKRLGLVK